MEIGTYYPGLHVVKAFPNVFPKAFQGFSLNKEIKFCIDLIYGEQPVSIALYEMAPMELIELRKQLDELLEKGFIRSSTSSWEALVLFSKKVDGSFRLCKTTTS